MSTTAVEVPVDEFGDPVEPEPAAASEGAPPPGQEPPAPPVAGEEPAPTEEQPEWAARFQSPEEMYEAFKNVDTLRGRLANEVGQLRRQPEPAPAPQPQAAQVPMVGELTVEQYQAWKDEEPEEALAYWAEQRVQQSEAAMQARLEQEMAPLRQSAYQAGAKSAIDLLQQELGPDTVLRHQEALGERIAADEAYFLDQATLHTRMSDYVKAREYERLTSPQRPRAANGQFAEGAAAPPVHIEGGSTPPPPSAAQAEVDPVIAEMDEEDPGHDMFGRLGPGSSR